MNDNPVASIAFGFASEIIPASATTVMLGWELVRGHERFDGRQHRLGLGFVALETRRLSAEPVLPSERLDRDLRFLPPFFSESRLAGPVPASVSKYSVLTS
ncbi:MAG TPA: hypothetical protein VN969_41495 [Streptosporangiaceae bacterium]|nr:hypothetical protein [Streptosporangiaceae bacterium]